MEDDGWARKANRTVRPSSSSLGSDEGLGSPSPPLSKVLTAESVQVPQMSKSHLLRPATLGVPQAARPPYVYQISLRVKFLIVFPPSRRARPDSMPMIQWMSRVDAVAKLTDLEASLQALIAAGKLV